MVIWIAETLTDEHRRALDWLNDNMSIHPAAVDNRDAWPEIFTWLRERAELFASTFKPRLDTLDLSSAASELAGGEADTLGAETAASDALG